MGFSPRVRVAVDPLVAAAHAIPKIAVLPILMILLGLGEAPKIAVVAAAAFFPLLISTMAGVRQISPIHFEVAHGYGASAPRIFWRVLVPGSLPQILSGTRLAFNAAPAHHRSRWRSSRPGTGSGPRSGWRGRRCGSRSSTRRSS